MNHQFTMSLLFNFVIYYLNFFGKCYGFIIFTYDHPKDFLKKSNILEVFNKIVLILMIIALLLVLYQSYTFCSDPAVAVVDIFSMVFSVCRVIVVIKTLKDSNVTVHLLKYLLKIESSIKLSKRARSKIASGFLLTIFMESFALVIILHMAYTNPAKRSGTLYHYMNLLNFIFLYSNFLTTIYVFAQLLNAKLVEQLRINIDETMKTIKEFQNINNGLTNYRIHFKRLSADIEKNAILYGQLMTLKNSVNQAASLAITVTFVSNMHEIVDLVIALIVKSIMFLIQLLFAVGFNFSNNYYVPSKWRGVHR